MNTPELCARLQILGVVPVIAIEDPDAALPLADALLEGGLPVAEITFRTTAAARVIEILARERPEVLVGAGTVLSREQLLTAQTAGAHFAFAPGLNPTMVRAAHELGVPFIPGVATPSELEQALALGCSVLKIFPVEVLGGLQMLSSLSGPYQSTGVKLVPTGGVTPANLEAYLKCRIVAAVGGSWIARQEDLVAGKWTDIRRRCQAVVEIVRGVRTHAL